MSTLNLKPAHKAVKAYYDALQAVAHLDFSGEVYPRSQAPAWERPFPPKLQLGLLK